MCAVDGLSAPTGNCSAGWFCTGGSWMAEPTAADNTTDLATCSCPDANYTGGRCWPGSYCPAGSAYPLACSYGQYCDQWTLSAPAGLCDAGYYCNGSAEEPNPSERECPPGYYCEQGSGTPTQCPAGTMSDVTGAMNLTWCDACTAGYYCEGPADTAVTGPCDEGYYCPAGQQVATPADFFCTLGHYCPVGTADPVPCPPGYYQDEILQSVCKSCLPGKYCDRLEANNGTITPVDCPAGEQSLKILEINVAGFKQ